MVVVPATGRPMTIGTKKYAQKMNINSGRPRTSCTTAVAGQRKQRHGLMRPSASSTPQGSARTRLMAARPSVAASPPSGPCGYCPINSSSQLSFRVSHMVSAPLADDSGAATPRPRP